MTEHEAYERAKEQAKSHDTSRCGGAWRAHTDPDERRACIAKEDMRPRWYQRKQA
jgi:hypothetical protein